jgi:uncharacterized membrane protein HdeD (DUF308 family)
MIRLLIRNWWLLLVRGLFAVAFAISIFVFLPFVPAPLLRELAFAGLVVVFALFAIVTGAITIAAAVRGAGQSAAAWLLLADGVAVCTGGIVILLSPALTLWHVIQLIAVTILLVGVLETAAGFHLRRHVADERLLVAGGVISIIFAGCLLLTHPDGSQTVLTWISVYALANGLAMAGLALRLRALRNKVHELAGAAASSQAKTQSGAA